MGSKEQPWNLTEEKEDIARYIKNALENLLNGKDPYEQVKRELYQSIKYKTLHCYVPSIMASIMFLENILEKGSKKRRVVTSPKRSLCCSCAAADRGECGGIYTRSCKSYEQSYNGDPKTMKTKKRKANKKIVKRTIAKTNRKINRGTKGRSTK